MGVGFEAGCLDLGSKVCFDFGVFGFQAFVHMMSFKP